MTVSVQRSVLTALVFLSVSAQAKANLVAIPSYSEAEGSMTAELGNASSKKGIAVGYQYGFVEYNEPGLMKEHGSLHGINVSYDWNLESKFIRFESDYSAGNLTYDGATWGGTPVSSGTTDMIFNLRGMGVWTHRFSATTMVNWFGGLGFRYLNDKILNAGGYEREITYLYFPVGVGLTQQLKSGWSIGGNLEYDIFFMGRVKSHLSDVNPNDADIENSQTSGFGARVNVNVRKDFQTYAIKIQPYFQYWNIKDSNVVQLKDKQGRPKVDDNGRYMGVFEPQNDSKMFGLNVIAEI